MSTTQGFETSSAQYELIDPLLDVRALRGALGKYATGVAVITTKLDGQPLGMTVNSFAAVSLDPPLILWSIQNSSGRFESFTRTERFSVNVLGAEQAHIARAVASADAASSAFDSFDWSTGNNGSPLINGAIARFECSRQQVLPGGDHQIIIGKIEEISECAGEPLLFVKGGYARAEALPLPLTGADSEPDTSDTAEDIFLQALSSANYSLSTAFDNSRKKHGLSAVNSRVLKRLCSGRLKPKELSDAAYLSEQSMRDALAELSEAGLVEFSDGYYAPTFTGRSLRERISRDAQAFNEEMLGGFSATDIATTLKVLNTLAKLPHREINKLQGEKS